MQATTTEHRPAWAECVPANMTIECHEHAASVWAFAERTGRTADLRDKLERLANIGRNGRVRLMRDFAPQSFTFAVEIKRGDEWRQVLFGGLIFHGSHDGGGNGGAPTYSVSLEPCDGWSIHT